MLGTDIHVFRRHDLSNGQQAVTFAGFRHHCQPFHANPLEAVRSGTRLEGTSAQYLAAGSLDQPGNLIDLLRRFHGTRTAHNDHILSADLHSADIDNRILRMEVSARQLIGFGNLNYILHALHLAKMLGKLRSDAPYQSDYGMVSPYRDGPASLPSQSRQ